MKCKSRFSKKWTIAIVAAAALALPAICTNVLMNGLLMIMEPNYVLPLESNVFSFSARTMNSGSGDWWNSGEDGTSYYFMTDSDGIAYYVFPKAQVEKCPGFNPDSITTWCPAIKISRLQKDVGDKNSLAWIFH